MNALAIFGFGAIGVGAWAGINKPDKSSVGAALALMALIAVGLGFGAVDCNHLFRCL